MKQLGNSGRRLGGWLAGLIVGLAGVGMVPAHAAAQAVSFSPSSLSWYNTQIGVTSGAKSVTVTNNQTTALSITSITVGANFFESASTCPLAPSTLAAGASCSISVTFRPLAQGALTASLSLNDDASGSPQTVALSGTGVVGPILFSPTSLTFSGVPVGSVSAAQTATVTNTTSSALTISVSKWGVFDQTNNCPGTLAAQASCTVSVTFNPTSNGIFSGAVAVKYGTSSDDLFLSGTTGSGSSDGVTLTPTSANFGSEQVGATTAAQTFTLSNSQAVALTISSISTNLSDFLVSTNCPLSPNTLAAGGSCDIMVSFDPTTTGTRSGTLAVYDNAAGSPVTATLTGTGTTSTASTAVGFSPASLSFGNTIIGAAAGAKSVSITNEQSVALSISSITTGPDYFESASNCPIAPSTLAAGASCTVSVRFRPMSQGTLSESLSINDNASGSPQTMPLTGTGVVGPFLYSPTSLTFSTTTDGTMSPAQSATLTNTTSSPIAITSFSKWGQFVQSNNCPISPNTLAAKASCTVSVSFNPTSNGVVTGGIQVNYGTDSGIALYVTGTGSTGTVGGGSSGPLTLTPSTGFFFNAQIVKRSSTPQILKVYNGQSTSLTISSIASSSSSYIQTNNCIGTLAPYASCSVSISFDPQTTGTINGTISILSSGSSTAQSISLTGSGIIGNTFPYVIVSPQNSCVQPDHALQFSASVQNESNTAVNWYVDYILNGNSTVGTITSQGLYTAPASAGNHVIRAVSVADTAASALSTVSVTSSPGFYIYPFTSSLEPSLQQTFQGQICGIPDENVTYSVDNIEGGNTTVGTITSSGVYTAPATAGQHTVRVTDATLNKTSGAVVTVYSDISVDFGSRTNNAFPIPANMFGANHSEYFDEGGPLTTLMNAGLTQTRSYAQIPLVYATTTPDWSKIDPQMQLLQTAGIHPILQLFQSPPWLVNTSTSCGTASQPPDNFTEWGQIAAAYVAHMDATFPGLVKDYEIWNEPNGQGMCGHSLSTYLSIYAAAAPLMKQQAAADGVQIRIGGPATAGFDSYWISSLISNTSTAPYVDFVSYHQYLFSAANLEATWDSYDGSESLYQRTQDPSIGAASTYHAAAALLKAGKQPLGALTPIYIDEYNTNSTFMPDCCKNDPTYAPLWNALYVSDLLNSVYTGTAAVPGKLIYYAATAYPYFCMLGTWDSYMDCQNSIGSTPVPYPQYYAYQLMASRDYLDLQDGGAMAASISPPTGGGGIAVTAFYTPNKDSVLVVNPTSNSYQQITVNLQNLGYNSPQATLYQIVNGNAINPSTLALSGNGSSYTATISVPAYSVLGISIQ